MSDTNPLPDVIGGVKTLFVRNNYATSEVEIAVCVTSDAEPQNLQFLTAKLDKFPALSATPLGILMRIRVRRMAAPVFGPSRALFALRRARDGRALRYAIPHWMAIRAHDLADRIEGCLGMAERAADEPTPVSGGLPMLFD